jgi:hypothetical protein
MFLGAYGSYGNRSLGEQKTRKQLDQEAADRAAEQQKAQTEALLAPLRAQAAAQAKALKAKEDAARYNEAVQYAQQQAQTGNQEARQQIASYNQAQQAQDTAAQQTQQSSMQSGAQAAVGGAGFNPAMAAKQSFANIGMGGGASMINQAPQAARATPPANQTGASSNKFTLPSASGINFGGF